MKARNYLKAKWLPLGHSNRLKAAPDLVKNETILLFKFGDVDEYYWTTIFREVELREDRKLFFMDLVTLKLEFLLSIKLQVIG